MVGSKYKQKLEGRKAKNVSMKSAQKHNFQFDFYKPTRQNVDKKQLGQKLLIPEKEKQEQLQQKQANKQKRKRKFMC